MIMIKGYNELSEWDRRYLDLAHHVSQWSKDPSTKVGSVLIGRRQKGHISLGYNGFPPGVEDTPERLEEKRIKYLLMQHAERNALDNAEFCPIGGTLYVTLFHCSQCAGSAVVKGVSEVICPPPPLREPWASDAEWTKTILAEGGVDLTEVIGIPWYGGGDAGKR